MDDRRETDELTNSGRATSECDLDQTLNHTDHTDQTDTTTTHVGETHASMGGAAAAGAVTGGVIGLTGGPIGAAIGAVGGAIVGAAAERMMHSDDESLSDAESQSAAIDTELDSTSAERVRSPGDTRQ